MLYQIITFCKCGVRLGYTSMKFSVMVMTEKCIFRGIALRTLSIVHVYMILSLKEDKSRFRIVDTTSITSGAYWTLLFKTML